MQSKKIMHLLLHVLAVISLAIMSFTHKFYIYCIWAVLLLIIYSFILHYSYFNEKENFDKDSIHIWGSYFIPILFLISITFFGLSIKASLIYLKDFTIFSFKMIFIIWIYFLIIYFFRCKKVITEIRKDKHLFIGKMIESTLNTFLVFVAATVFVISFPGDNNVKVKLPFGIQNYVSLIYQLLNISINSIILFIDMFSYVRSEIDEFNKEEKEKQEQLIKEKRELLKRDKCEEQEKQKQEKEKREELEKEKYKFDLYNY